MADDLELLRGFVERGEEGAFGRVVENNARWLFAAAYRQVRDVQLAEDVVQGVFVLLIKRAERVVRSGNVAGWLFLALQNVVRNVRRSEAARRRRELAAGELMRRNAERAMDDASELAEVLDGAVEKLPGKYREAVVMRFYREMAFEEVARATGTTEAGARKRVERGVEMLRGKLGTGVSSAAVSAGVMHGSAFVPAGLGETAARVALSAKAGVAVPSGVAASTKGVVMAAAKAKIAAAVVVAGLVVVPTAVTIVKRMQAPVVSPRAAVSSTTGSTAVGTFTVSPETTVVVGPLNADGTPDYVAAMNERYSGGVKPGENAFVGWMEVAGGGEDVVPARVKEKVIAMSGARPPEKGLAFSIFNDVLKAQGKGDDPAAMNEDLNSMRRLWRAQEFPVMAAQLKEGAAFLDAMEGVWKRPKYWFPAVSDASLMGVTLPPLGKIRSAGNALTSRALLRMEGGDFEGFLSDVVTVQRMARRLAGSYSLMEALVGNALDAQASRAIGAAAGSGRLTKEQCARLGKAMEEAGAMPAVWPKVDCFERWTRLDVELLVRAGKLDDLAAGMKAKEFESAWGVFETVDAGGVDWDDVLKETNRAMDEEVAAMKEPTVAGVKARMKEITERYEAGKKVRDLGREGGETREAYTKRVTAEFLKKTMADFTGVTQLQRGAVMQEEMARAVVAAAAYKAEKGAWPESLEGLVPGYLKAVPTDIYSANEGEAVKYGQGETGVRVYSVGRNGIDEGGVQGVGKGDDLVVGEAARVGAGP